MQNEPQIHQWQVTIRGARAGRIVAESGRVVEVRRRWMPYRASLPEVFFERTFRPQPPGRCVLDYHLPRRCPGYITLDYVRSGRDTSFASFRAAIFALDRVADLHAAEAIVCHVTTPSLSDRLLRRWGWQQHCLQWKGRHWIKRFDRSQKSMLDLHGRSAIDRVGAAIAPPKAPCVP